MHSTSRKFSCALTFEALEPRLALSGVTVITHGFQFFGSYPDWPITAGQAILERADGDRTDRVVGSLFKHNPATSSWEPMGADVWNNSNNPQDSIVLLYDWADDSNDFDDGWLEAAADNLFASLLQTNDNLGGLMAGTTFYDAALASGQANDRLDLHLIGHSRGAVLNSLVTQRLDYYFPVMVDQVTSLDPHPASSMNDPGYVSDDPNTNSRLFTYGNVAFADNYFEQNGSYEPLFGDFNGVLAAGAYNLQIPAAVLEVGGSSLEHSDLHTWYYGTVTTPFDATYTGFSGAGRNHDGDVSFPESWYGNSGLPARDEAGFHFSQTGGGSRDGSPISGEKLAAGSVASVLNGDFSLGNTTLVDELPGWERHGGGGSAGLGSVGDDFYLQLESGSDNYFKQHNRLYFSADATALQFDYWIDGPDPQLDDQLQVLVGDTVIDTLSLSQATGDFVRGYTAPLDSLPSGSADTLQFRINDTGGNGINAAVRIDNVRLRILSADFDIDHDVDGTDFLAWQRGFGMTQGATRADGDADEDGTVDHLDLATWQETFPGAPGITTAASANLAAPIAEPAAIDQALGLGWEGVLTLRQRGTPWPSLARQRSNSTPAMHQERRDLEGNTLDRKSLRPASSTDGQQPAAARYANGAGQPLASSVPIPTDPINLTSQSGFPHESSLANESSKNRIPYLVFCGDGKNITDLVR